MEQTSEARRIEFPEGGSAVICRSSLNSKFIICRELGERIEGDEIAGKRGHFRTSDEAEAFARTQSAACAGICSW